MRGMGLFVVLGSLIVACGLREHSSGWIQVWRGGGGGGCWLAVGGGV